MGYVLILAEKPDQGLALVSQFKYRRKDGYLEVEANELFPNGAYCTWAIGHLTQLCNPEHYHAEWKKWSLNTLPMMATKSKILDFTKRQKR